MSLTVNTSDHMYDDSVCFLFLHVHREVSALDGELTEESDRFGFLYVACLVNLKDSVGLILTKTSVRRDYFLRLIYESFHKSPSLHSVSSHSPSSHSFPSPISSTLCLSGA